MISPPHPKRKFYPPQTPNPTPDFIPPTPTRYLYPPPTPTLFDLLGILFKWFLHSRRGQKLSLMKISLNARLNSQFKPVLHSRRGQKIYFNEFVLKLHLNKIFYDFRTFARSKTVFLWISHLRLVKNHILAIFAIKARSKSETIFQRILHSRCSLTPKNQISKFGVECPPPPLFFLKEIDYLINLTF